MHDRPTEGGRGKKAEVGRVKDTANELCESFQWIQKQRFEENNKKKGGRVSTCSSAANLRPTLPVRTIVPCQRRVENCRSSSLPPTK